MFHSDPQQPNSVRTMYNIDKSGIQDVFTNLSPSGIEYPTHHSSTAAGSRNSPFFPQSPQGQQHEANVDTTNSGEQDMPEQWYGQNQSHGQESFHFQSHMLANSGVHQMTRAYSPHQHMGSHLVDPRMKMQQQQAGVFTAQQSVAQHGYYPAVIGGRPQQSMLNSSRVGLGQRGYPNPLQMQMQIQMQGQSGQFGQHGQQIYPGYGSMGMDMGMPPPPQHDGKSLNKVMLGIMRDRVFNPSKLTAVLDSNLDIMDCVNLATLLFHTGKKRFALPPALILRIAARLNTIDGELRAREASNALYGLRCLNPERPEVRQLIAALTHKFAASPTKLVAQAVGNAVYGLQSLTSEYEEVRGLLRVLAPKISQCREQLEAQNVGNALYGMKGMSSDYAEVRALLAALTPKIADVCETLNGQAIGNSLYGLQCCNSREVEVRGILHVLTVLIARSWDSLNTQEIGNSLYGLQRMSSDHAEVRELLHAMTVKVSQSAACLDAQAVGNALYGMKNMNSDSPEVRALLQVLAIKIRSSSVVLDGQSIGNGLYGLQSMDSVYPEVRFLVQVLAHKVQFSPVKMNPQELGDAVFGLRRMSADYEEVRDMLVALTSKFASCRATFSVQEIGNMMLGMQGMSSDHPEVRALIEVMTEKIVGNKMPFDGHSCANCLSGLELMSSDHGEVLRLVAVLTSKLRSSSFEHVVPKQLVMCFAGCGRLCAGVPEVSRLMASLGEKLLHCSEPFTPLHVAMTMQGLKSSGGDHPEIKMILSGVSAKVDLLIHAASAGEIDPRFVFTFDLLAMAVNGLQGMGSLRTDCARDTGKLFSPPGLEPATDVRVLDELLSKLTQLFCLHNGLKMPSLSSQLSLGLGLGGELGLDEKLCLDLDGEVVVPPEAQASMCFVHTDSRTFSDLLFGLQRMETSRSPALVALLKVVKAVCSLAASSHQPESDDFHMRVDVSVSVGNSMLGLANCDASLPCVDYLLGVAASKLEDVAMLFREVCLEYERARGNNTEGVNQELVYTRMIDLYQHLVLSLHALKPTMRPALVERFTVQMDILRQLVGARYGELHSHLYQISSYDLLLAECLHSGLQQPGVTLSTNDLLYGFPSTILITCAATEARSPTLSVSSESELERSVLGDVLVLEESGSTHHSANGSPHRGSSPASDAPVLINVEADHCEAGAHQNPTTQLLRFLRQRFLRDSKDIAVVHLPPLELLQCGDSVEDITAVLRGYFSQICEHAPAQLKVPSASSLTQIAGIVMRSVEQLGLRSPSLGMGGMPQLHMTQSMQQSVQTHPASVSGMFTPGVGYTPGTGAMSAASASDTSAGTGRVNEYAAAARGGLTYDPESFFTNDAVNMHAMYYPSAGSY